MPLKMLLDPRVINAASGKGATDVLMKTLEMPGSVASCVPLMGDQRSLSERMA
jgi:hypothetical protein